jgi:predicted RNA-binding Zn-ribbon protein involved in translation (DUF1610 family)
MPDDQSDLDAMKHALREWRRAHPNATLREMEGAVEEQIAAMRAGMLQEIATDREETIQLCPQCGRRMHRRGERTRDLEVPGGRPVELARSYYTCPHCELGLFPPG